MRIRRGISVLAIVDGLRERHPEFRRPVRAELLRRVFDREGIQVTKAAVRQRAFVDGADGIFVITMRNNVPVRMHTKVLLHEYAHAKLHLTDTYGDVTRQLLACKRGDIREYEADLFAALLWYGPDATPSHPVIAKLFAKVEGPGFVRPLPAQIPLPLAEGMPRYRRSPPRSTRRAATPAKERFQWKLTGPKPSIPGSSLGLNGVSHDAIRFNMDRGGKPLGFFHYDLGWVDVYDRMVIEEAGRRRSVMLRCGDARAQQRLFVISSDDRRLYTFIDKESRRPGVKELDRQLLLAIRKEARTMTRERARQSK